MKNAMHFVYLYIWYNKTKIYRTSINHFLLSCHSLLIITNYYNIYLLIQYMFILYYVYNTVFRSIMYCDIEVSLIIKHLFTNN